MRITGPSIHILMSSHFLCFIIFHFTEMCFTFFFLFYVFYSQEVALGEGVDTKKIISVFSVLSEGWQIIQLSDRH